MSKSNKEDVIMILAVAYDFAESAASTPWWVYIVSLAVFLILLVLFIRVYEYTKAIKEQSEAQTELLQSISHKLDEIQKK